MLPWHSALYQSSVAHCYSNGEGEGEGGWVREGGREGGREGDGSGKREDGGRGEREGGREKASKCAKVLRKTGREGNHFMQSYRHV